MNVVVSPPYIELSEEGATGEAVDGLGYEGGYVAIFLRPSVYRAIVLDWMKFSVLFLYEKEVGGVRAPRLPDGPSC